FDTIHASDDFGIRHQCSPYESRGGLSCPDRSYVLVGFRAADPDKLNQGRHQPSSNHPHSFLSLPRRPFFRLYHIFLRRLDLHKISPRHTAAPLGDWPSWHQRAFSRPIFSTPGVQRRSFPRSFQRGIGPPLSYWTDKDCSSNHDPQFETPLSW